MCVPIAGNRPAAIWRERQFRPRPSIAAIARKDLSGHSGRNSDLEQTTFLDRTFSMTPRDHDLAAVLRNREVPNSETLRSRDRGPTSGIEIDSYQTLFP